jgi:hypothetical protein
MWMLITTIRLNTSESECHCLGKLIAFQLTKNKMPFLTLQQIYEGRFPEKHS